MKMLGEYFESHKRQFENYWGSTSINSMTRVYEFEEADNSRLINVIQEVSRKEWHYAAKNG